MNATTSVSLGFIYLLNKPKLFYALRKATLNVNTRIIRGALTICFRNQKFFRYYIDMRKFKDN